MPFKKKTSPNYYMDITVNGTRVNRSTGTPDLQEAVWIEDQVRSELQTSGTTVDKMRLQEALEFVSKERWSRTTTGQQSEAKVKVIIKILENPRLDDFLNDQHASKPVGIKLLRKLRIDLIGAGLGESTVDQYLKALQTCLKFTRDELPLPELALPKFPMANVKNARERVIRKHEEKRLLALAPTRDIRDFWTVLIDTGMRTSELINLKWSDNVFLADRSIRLTDKQTKTGKGRTIPMTTRVHDILAGRMSWPKSWSRFTLAKAFKKVRVKMGLAEDGEFVQHSCRHTCCTRLLEGGLNYFAVQTWMGHSSAEMTARYGHYAAGSLTEGAAILEGMHK